MTEQNTLKTQEQILAEINAIMATKTVEVVPTSPKINACPTDPQERLLCDSCQ